MGPNGSAIHQNILNMERRTIKVEVEIEYEYDPNHPTQKGMGVEFADACAKDLAIQPNGNSIVDGVRLIHVCNREENAWWLIKREDDGKEKS